MKINRRQIIMGGTVLAGGAVTGLFRSSGVFGQSFALTNHEYVLLTEVVDMIIPETDTPGAKATGVPQFINMILNDWYSRQERERFLVGLHDLDRRSPASDFLSCSMGKRVEILQEIDIADMEGYNFFRQLKEVTFWGYYTSEAGATEELRYEAIPGSYRGCIAFEEIGRTWAT